MCEPTTKTFFETNFKLQTTSDTKQQKQSGNTKKQTQLPVVFSFLFLGYT